MIVWATHHCIHISELFTGMVGMQTPQLEDDAGLNLYRQKGWGNKNHNKHIDIKRRSFFLLYEEHIVSIFLTHVKV